MEEQKTPVVSGTNIVRHTEEAMEKKRQTITDLINRMNAEAVVGEIIDEHEEERQKAIEEQRDLLLKEQEEREAEQRRELEEQLAAEAALAETKQKGSESEGEEDGKTSLAAAAAELSRKAKTELFKNKFFRKVFGGGTPAPDEAETPAEEETETARELLSEAAEEPQSPDTRKKQKEKPEKQPKPKKVKPEKVKEPRKKAEKPKKEKPEKPDKIKTNQTYRNISFTFSDEEVMDEIPEPAAPAKEVPEPEPGPAPASEARPLPNAADQKRSTLQEEIAGLHEPVNGEEVTRFREALERLSDDSYSSVSVYAACIIDREFKSLSIIKNVELLANLIEESSDSLDFYFAYIITNKGVQHYGSDEAISDVSLAMEAIRTLFVQKRGRVNVEQIQRLPSLQLFQTIYYEDGSRPAMRR